MPLNSNSRRALVKGKPIVVVTGALATVFLTGCAASGNGYGSVGRPDLVNASETPSAEPSASPSTPALSPKLTDTLVAKTLPRMGDAVTDGAGFVLYRFDKDSANPPTSNCEGKCADIWPPAYTDGNPTLQGIPIEKVGTVTRADGTRQLTIGGWPVYHYIGDLKPGAWKGQGIGGTWFVVTKDGKKNMTCRPAGTPTPVAPPPPAPTPTTGNGY
jgi:predicted lipoprotein with Yx(FWY)xxD motif